MPLDPGLLELLACPVCHGGLKDAGATLDCEKCAKKYPVVDGIPNLIA